MKNNIANGIAATPMAQLVGISTPPLIPLPGDGDAEDGEQDRDAGNQPEGPGADAGEPVKGRAGIQARRRL